MDKAHKQKACINPMAVFQKPNDVLNESDLTTVEKIAILKRWEYDARELQVAEEENMTGGPDDTLDQVLKALISLNASSDDDSPTKQGGA